MSHDISKSSPPLNPISDLSLDHTPNEILSLAISINGHRQQVSLSSRDVVYPPSGSPLTRSSTYEANEFRPRSASADERPKQGPDPTINYAYINGEYYLISSSDPLKHVDGSNYLELTTPASSPPTQSRPSLSTTATLPVELPSVAKARPWNPPPSWNIPATNGSGPPPTPPLRPPLGLKLQGFSNDVMQSDSFAGFRPGFRCLEPECGGGFFAQEDMEAHARERHGVGVEKARESLDDEGKWAKVYGTSIGWGKAAVERVGHPRAW